MDFYNKNSYTLADIESLITNEVEEDIHLDYKEARALAKDDKKRIEITKDVSAFANSDGGIIVYGVAEAGNKPKAISPIDGREITKEWLENVILSIQPRIVGLKIFPIRVESAEKSIYVVQIPRSDDAPHMAKDNRYYKRINFQSVPMEDYEVKDLYNRVSTPKLEIDGCAFWQDEVDKDTVTYKLKATIINVGKQACKFYKLNFYINNAQYCTFSHKSMDVRNLCTIMGGNRLKISFNSQAPIYPEESIDVGFFLVSVKKQNSAIFLQNLVIDMILFYAGGKDELAYIPSTKEFVYDRTEVVQILQENYLADDQLPNV